MFLTKVKNYSEALPIHVSSSHLDYNNDMILVRCSLVPFLNNDKISFWEENRTDYMGDRIKYISKNSYILLYVDFAHCLSGFSISIG